MLQGLSPWLPSLGTPEAEPEMRAKGPVVWGLRGVGSLEGRKSGVPLTPAQGA